ncbi:5-methylcytosine restriction system specificity protein McrC [Rothia sp. CCM 9417]|uniref:5-methylcytosine restriction system specificity protein McrC n=1 Tax=Rothia sp. CCM 9417 TaxID=3402657 RepID=UPI003AECC167
MGLTVLRVPIPQRAEEYRTIVFHILPKLWRPNETKTYTLNLQDIEVNEDSHFVLYEQDIIHVQAPCLVTLLTTLVEESPTELAESSESERSALADDDESRLSPLWYITSAPKRGTDGPLKPGSKQDISAPEALWAMLDAYQVKIEPIPTSKDFGSAGTAMFASSKFMKRFVYMRFVEEAMLALRDRRPQYVLHTDEITTVKGRMIPEGLIRRQITGSPKIECEFDELTTDNHIWQVIRTATELCVPDLKTHHVAGKKTSYAKALLIAAQLRDVTVASRHALLSQATHYKVSRQESFAVRKSYELARAILKEKFNATVNSQIAPGVVANLKYSMNGLWEQLVLEQFNNVDNTKAKSQKETDPVHIFYGRESNTWSKALDGGKRPDAVVDYESGGEVSTFYVDAKYKNNALGITKASMGDQYQMAAYALRTKRNVYLAYPTCDTGLINPEPKYQYIPYADSFTDGQEQPSTEHFVQVGQFYLPFPSQEDAQQRNFVLKAGSLNPQLVRQLAKNSSA